nr:tombus P33-like protein [Tolivirales sp.]
MAYLFRDLVWPRGPSRGARRACVRRSDGEEQEDDGAYLWDKEAFAAYLASQGAVSDAIGTSGGPTPGGNPPTPAEEMVATRPGDSEPVFGTVPDFLDDGTVVEKAAAKAAGPTEQGGVDDAADKGVEGVIPPKVGVSTEQERVAKQRTTRAVLSARQRATMALAASPVGKALRIVLALLWGTGKERVLDPAAEKAAAAMLASLDCEGATEEAGLLYATLHQRNRCAGQIALEVKAADGFMTPKYSEANVLVVQRKVADLLAKRNVRKSHIPHLVPIAVALVFTPTQEEIMMQQYMASQAFADRQRDAGIWARVENGRLAQGAAPTRA